MTCGVLVDAIDRSGNKVKIRCKGYVTKWGGKKFDLKVPCSHRPSSALPGAAREERSRGR